MNIMHNSVILTQEDINAITHQKDSYVKKIYDELIGRFTIRQLVPGQVLNRRKLAEEFGVSVSPVLEALVQLEQDGFIETIPRVGAVVRPVRNEDAYAQLLIRDGIECNAARIYAGKCVSDNFDCLYEYAIAMDKMVEEGKLFSLEFTNADLCFHASLVNLCKMPILTREFIRSVRIGVFVNINRVDGVFNKSQSHVDLLEGLLTSDSQKAVSIVRDHLWSGKPEVIYKVFDIK